jgi:Mg-chelatase subunit ChlD
MALTERKRGRAGAWAAGNLAGIVAAGLLATAAAAGTGVPIPRTIQATGTPTSALTPTTASTTPSPTLTASSTPSAPSTPTATSTSLPPTGTPSATHDPLPHRAWLPIALNVACRTEQTKADVVLLIDASTSMRELDGAVAKIDAARRAAHELIELLQLGRDRAAVIEFHSVPHLIVPLTANAGALHEAVDAIATATGTRIDLALDAAAEELRVAARRGSVRVVLLMTDGRPAAGGTEAVLAQATALKQEGTVIYVVGLGADVDADLLRRVASRPDTYLQAPTAGELGLAFREIGAQIPCPGGGVWLEHAMRR